ncbi:MAG TPA: acyltransferase [Acidimicrobiales bacterium]|nr:acyltransferase [Acidimicrobiales bacterium]
MRRGPLTSRPSGHVWAIDVVRLLTFAAVICVHCIAYTDDPANPGANAMMVLLQFGREVFFSITGFVLMWSAIGRAVVARPFWRKRITFVAVPYLTWTLLYYLVDLDITPHLSWSWSTLGLWTLEGAAFYHLYFLLVSMQLYLVFPVLVRLVRATAPHAWRWLGGVTAVNLCWLAVLEYVPIPHGTASWFWIHGFELLPTYATYVLAGCYAALYQPQLDALLTRNPRRVVALAGACAAGAMVVYSLQLRWMDPRSAGSVLQPAQTLACAAAVLVVGLVGTRWANGPRRGQRWVALGSDISFGVYLVHPLVLTVLLNNGLGTNDQRLPQPVCTVLAFVGVVTGSTLLAWVLRQSPVSLALVGRARLRGRLAAMAAVVRPATAWATGADRRALR